MLKSMTGFGRASREIGGYLISVEIKSVNHRYFEFSCRLPRQYAFAEEKMKSFINSRIARGKVDCFLSIEALNAECADVAINKTLANAYIKALAELSSEYGVSGEVSALALARFPDIFVLKKAENDEEQLWEYIKEVADEALEKFIAMRSAEGEKLKADVNSRADFILECVSYVEERSPETVREYNEKLVERVKELLGTAAIDEARILQEVAVYADKVAVAEETVRLRSHIAQLREFLESSEPVGRKMDFLVQEINREANTIGSKANDVSIARKVVDIKAEIEKIREQIQNIE